MRACRSIAQVLSEMPDFQLKMLRNDAAIRVTMASERTRQAVDTTSKSFTGPGIVWTADDTLEPDWKYLLLVNIGGNESEVGDTPNTLSAVFF
jgi:hypothetical protein